jgi:hypothetical protein
MAYLSEIDLKNYANDIGMSLGSRGYILKESAAANKTIFLSHSHKDKALVEGLINYLATFGIKLYVDWQDSEMPRVTDRKTAENIKQRIRNLDFFLVLATQNALASRWVPWEAGVADQFKSTAKIAVIPVADPAGRFDGNEYLQLYNRILFENGKLCVYEVGYQYQKKNLNEWLSA